MAEQKRKDPTYEDHWFVRSLRYEPPRIPQTKRPIRNSAGQKPLPGMTQVDIAHLEPKDATKSDRRVNAQTDSQEQLEQLPTKQ